MGLAVLLDGIAIRTTDATTVVKNGEARVRYGGDWFTAGFGQLEPGDAVALHYVSFTNTSGAALPVEIYSPSEVQVSAPGYTTHYYAAEVNGKNPRVSAQWTNRLATGLP